MIKWLLEEEGKEIEDLSGSWGVLSVIFGKSMASKYATYAGLARAGTSYARRMGRLSARIFGEVVQPTNIRSSKVSAIFATRPLHSDPTVMHYYPRLMETGKLMMRLRELGLFRDEHQDFREEMRRLRALRGKVKVWRRKAAPADST